MSKPNENIGLLEKISGIALLFGLCAVATGWWFGGGLWDSLLVGFVFTMAGGLIGLTVDGLNTGKLGIRGGYVYRQKQPAFFWGCVVFYVIVAVGLFGVATIGLLALFSGT